MTVRHVQSRVTSAAGAGGALGIGVALALVSVALPPAGAWGAGMALTSALLCAIGIWAFGVARFGWLATLTSPLGVAAVVLVCIFALRPAVLIADPRAATPGLIAIEFGWTDLTRTVGIGTLGFAVFGAMFLLLWRSNGLANTQRAELPSERRLIGATAAGLGVGSVLWGALFFRNGGFDALLNNPAALHLQQFSGGYGTLGYMLCLGSALLLLWTWLRQPTIRLAWMLGLAVAVCALGAFGLQTRGPLVCSLVAAGAIVLWQRRPSRRTLVTLSCVGLALVMAFGYMRTIREYAQAEPLGDAISASARTSPLTILGDEFTEVENFVALERLVPDSLPRLSGRSLRDVPAAFFPRQLWGDKPLPIDYKLSRTVYGSGSRAGTPFTLAGELFWNFGVGGVVLGMAAFGALAGITWRAMTIRAGATGSIAGAIVFGYSYLVLTRPLGPMLLTLSMALVGFFLVALSAGLLRLRQDSRLAAGWR